MKATLHGFRQLLDASAHAQWVSDDELRIVLAKAVSTALLRLLSEGDIFPSLTDASRQTRFDKEEIFDLAPTSVVNLKLPRSVSKLVVARNLSAMLAIPGTQTCEPSAYVLLETKDDSVAWSQGEPLTGLPVDLVRYHHGVRLWQLLAEYADYENQAAGELLYFGLRKIALSEGLEAKSLCVDIAYAEIAAFLKNPDRAAVRREIFVAQLSEFLRDQDSASAFPFLLRGSDAFTRRLREGFAIYLAELSPGKLATEAKNAALALSERLEKVIGGLEAKSLSIPVALLLAVKDVSAGGGLMMINGVLLSSALLYGLTMSFAHRSQLTLLGILRTTISSSIAEFAERGLDNGNPVLKETMAGLSKRCGLAVAASWIMCVASWVPFTCIVWMSWFGSPKP